MLVLNVAREYQQVSLTLSVRQLVFVNAQNWSSYRVLNAKIIGNLYSKRRHDEAHEY